ncbi:hydroxymethylglutaryl-CoA lyase (plasmid) [Haloferax sp. S1W]|uniref:hydroxymethylglutaryl-CoA lyase n=1 Tax=Haloferax sp. S1W TaxID=3377110 RepID=UPI0037C95606
MPLAFPTEVTVVEMLPRDGLQRLDRFVPTEEKIRIIDALSQTGVSEIEVTSFTHPTAVPNLRDAAAVTAGITRQPGVTYRALVPNVIGLERAIEADIEKVNALITASEEYNRRNQNMTIEENLDEIIEVIERGHEAGLVVEAGIGMAFFSPYEGRTPPERTLAIVESVVDAGVDEVTLATSMGMANPKQVAGLVESVFTRWPDVDLGMHLHDTNGMSLANTVVAMQLGVERFDASVCGLGGGVILPKSMEDIGNTPTEDLVYMLSEMGIETGVDFEELTSVAADVMDSLDVRPNSHVLKGGTREQVLRETSES